MKKKQELKVRKQKYPQQVIKNTNIKPNLLTYLTIEKSHRNLIYAHCIDTELFRVKINFSLLLLLCVALVLLCSPFIIIRLVLSLFCIILLFHLFVLIGL